MDWHGCPTYIFMVITEYHYKTLFYQSSARIRNPCMMFAMIVRARDVNDSVVCCAICLIDLEVVTDYLRDDLWKFQAYRMADRGIINVSGSQDHTRYLARISNPT